MQKIITILTVFLIVLGAFVFFNRSSVEERVFTNIAEYRVYREEFSSMPPALPGCAEKIFVKDDGIRVIALSFLCEHKDERSEFVTAIEKNFDWNVLDYGNGRIELNRVEREE